MIILNQWYIDCSGAIQTVSFLQSYALLTEANISLMDEMK